MRWDDFGRALKTILLELQLRAVLVMLSRERPSLLVQISGVEAGGNIVVQLGYRDDGDDFSQRHVADLERRGFAEQFEHGRLWQRVLPWPTPSAAVAEVVQASLVRLRDIGGMGSPDGLQYRAWREPEGAGTSGLQEGLERGEDCVEFPSLGTPMQLTETW